MINAAKIKEDEIDLLELLLGLWAYKILIIALTLISIGIGVLYLSKTDKIYTSSTTFVLQDNPQNDIQSRLSSSFGALGSLVGFSNGQSSTAQLIEKITARNFILELDNDLDFRSDKFFNNYNENYSEPAWKALLKVLLNWKTDSIDPTRAADWNVLKAFNENVEITETMAGAIKVSVNHSDAEKAAKIANHIAAKVISLVKRENLDSSNEKLTYLSQKLADSLIKYENAEERLKNFTLSNSSASLASLNQGSIVLDDLRSQREKSKTQIDTIDILLPFAKRRSPTFQDYLNLRKDYRILDQADFRRILGISEVLSAWSWPTEEKLSQARESIKDRVGSLEAEIIKLEAVAKRYAQSAEEMQKLNRDLKVEEATYSVLIEQVKSLSLAAGFTPDRSKIIAAADVAISPSKPKRNLILALATVLGFFVSSLLALVLSSRTGYCYSEKSLLKSLNPNFTFKMHFRRRKRAETLNAAKNDLKRHPITWARQVLLESALNKRTTFTLIIDTTTSQYASTISRLLGVSAHELGLTVGFIDLSKSVDSCKTKPTEIASENEDKLLVTETMHGCTEYDYIGGKQNVEILFLKSFQSLLNQLEKKHDLVLLSADLNILDLLYTLKIHNNVNLVVHVSKGKTKSETIDGLNKKGNVDFALLT